MGKTDSAVNFLLQQMSDEEREQFAERLLEDPELFSEVQDAESSLYSEYLSGQMSAERRSAMEQTLLSTPEGRVRLASARGLRRAARSTRIVSPRMLGIGLALAAGLALAVLFVPRGTAPPSVTPPFAIVLEEPVRSAAIPEFVIPTSAQTVQFTTPVPRGHKGGLFHIDITRGKETIWSESEVQGAPGGTFTSLVPAKDLTPGVYVMHVTDADSDPVVYIEFSTRREP